MRTRAWYAGRFEAIEAAITTFAGQVRRLVSAGDLNEQGLFLRAQDPQNVAYGTGTAILNEVSAASRADHDAIEAVLAAPEPPRPVEVAMQLQYAQQLALREFDSDGDDPDLLDEWRQAIEAGDAIRAEVLNDLATTTIRPSGLLGISLSHQMTALRDRTIALRADPERRAALDLKRALDGGADAPGIDDRVNFVRSALGARLSLVLQEAGADYLVRSFTLDFPPIGSFGRFQSYGWAVDPRSLKRSFGQAFSLRS